MVFIELNRRLHLRNNFISEMFEPEDFYLTSITQNNGTKFIIQVDKKRNPQNLSSMFKCFLREVYVLGQDVFAFRHAEF